jgi:hypothetical protein
MAQKVQVVLTCDLDTDDTPAVETVAFSYGREEYEFELCQRHLDEFNGVMERFAGAARRRGPTGRRRQTAKADLGAIREWARQHGFEVSDRGRISAAVREAFDTAHR